MLVAFGLTAFEHSARMEEGNCNVGNKDLSLFPFILHHVHFFYPNRTSILRFTIVFFSIDHYKIMYKQDFS